MGSAHIRVMKMFTNPSTPRPSRPSRYTSPVTPPIPFAPLLKPPLPGTVPRLPRRPAAPPHLRAPSGITTRDFVIPAAHPRRYRGSYGNLQRLSDPFRSQLIASAESREDRRRYASQGTRIAIEARANAVELSLEEVHKGDLPGMWMAAERWKFSEAQGDGVTIVICHANGFQKEVSIKICLFSSG